MRINSMDKSQAVCLLCYCVGYEGTIPSYELFLTRPIRSYCLLQAQVKDSSIWRQSLECLWKWEKDRLTSKLDIIILSEAKS